MHYLDTAIILGGFALTTLLFFIDQTIAEAWKSRRNKGDSPP